jgi:DNA primase
LATKAGIELKRENVQLRTERQRLYEICDLACRFFEKQLEGSAIGKEAQDYLLGRGLSKESIKKWRVGYSPETWNGLSDFLIGKGYNREEVVKAGLAIEKEQNKADSYDRFRGRIMFPVFDLNSQVVGFGGRIFKQQNETAKYINTPQTLLYDKSNILYGLNNAKLAVRKQNQCVVTEGYTDVIMCHQAGFENTVAASGTALTSQHLSILKRYSENLVLAFDMDVAGDSATKRGINGAQEQGFNIKIIEHYGEGDKKSDPAEIIAKDSKIWEESLTKAKSIMDYYVDSALSHFDKSTPEGKKEISKIVLPAIQRLNNKIEQSYWVQKLSQVLGIREEAIVDELAKVKVTRQPTEAAKEIPPTINDAKLSPQARRKLIEEKMVSLLLKNPDFITLIEQAHLYLFSDHIKKFLEEVKKYAEKKGASDGKLQEDFKAVFSANNDALDLDAELKNFLAALTLRADVEYENDGEEEFLLCLLQLKNIELKNALTRLSEDMRSAEEKKDQTKVAQLMEQFNQLSKELK